MFGKKKTFTVAVEGIECERCKARVEKAILGVKGVTVFFKVNAAFGADNEANRLPFVMRRPEALRGGNDLRFPASFPATG